MYANYHTHTFRCGHAFGKEEEYIERAISCGLKILGFSDHTPFLFPDGYQEEFAILKESGEDYMTTLQKLREKYKDQIQIHIGYEMEYSHTYFKQMVEYVKQLGVEYLILGQHYVEDPDTKLFVLSKCEHGEKKLIEYTDAVIEGMETGAFLYVAHPDVLLYKGDETIYRREALRLCKAAKKLDIPLELNLLGIYDKRYYPNPIFLEVMSTVGNKVILGMDAHDPQRTYDKQSLEAAMTLVEKYQFELVEKMDITGIL